MDAFRLSVCLLTSPYPSTQYQHQLSQKDGGVDQHPTYAAGFHTEGSAPGHSAPLHRGPPLYDNEQRFLYVLRMVLASHSLPLPLKKKPFNPVLGETMHWEQAYCSAEGSMKYFKCVAEQVSHHPPICAYHYEDPGSFRMCGYAKVAKCSLVGTSLKIIVEGHRTIALPKPQIRDGDLDSILTSTTPNDTRNHVDTMGTDLAPDTPVDTSINVDGSDDDEPSWEEYEASSPSVSYSFFPTAKAEYSGEWELRCKATNLAAVIRHHPSGLATCHSLTGRITRSLHNESFTGDEPTTAEGSGDGVVGEEGNPSEPLPASSGPPPQHSSTPEPEASTSAPVSTPPASDVFSRASRLVEYLTAPSIASDLASSAASKGGEDDSELLYTLHGRCDKGATRTRSKEQPEGVVLMDLKTLEAGYPMSEDQRRRATAIFSRWVLGARMCRELRAVVHVDSHRCQQERQVLYDVRDWDSPTSEEVAAPLPPPPKICGSGLPMQSQEVWSEVISALHRSAWAEAKAAKKKVEQAQRDLRKARAATKTEWHPQLFEWSEEHSTWRIKSEQHQILIHGVLPSPSGNSDP
ncbi:hypothetical protein CYMTET_44851 [Cymbomonas tetramitiformis]|uniref:Oxysterol-binding protein n=1 Tax=Cymbomonas tetramitiformis TaxID=36881 RepID=A0AAE0F0A4_9CHLO|nr:hypothetical protein CYMTET_44851 [Cymbomonas tetramitiformis]